MLRVRVVSPPDRTDVLVAELLPVPGVVSLAVDRGSSVKPPGDVVVIDVVREARASGVKTAIVTNNVREFGDGWRSMLPVDELFDAVIDSAHVGVRKPDPRIFHLTLERLGGIAPQDAVFLDDFHGNVTAAEKLGMRGILVEEDHRPAMRLLRTMLA